MYENFKEVVERFRELGIYDKFGTKKEMKELPNLLEKDEPIEFANSGIVDGNSVLMVCTPKRILMIDKGMLYGIKATEIPLENIIQVSYKKGLLFGEIYIDVASGKRTILKNAIKELVEQMVRVIKVQKENLGNSSKKEQNEKAIVTNAAEQIRKFKELMDDGIITEEEFEAKKAELLKQ